MSLENTYLNIKAKFENDLGWDLEPFDIIKTVDEHRKFWKPEKVRILLLAESHVHTEMKDHKLMKYDGFDDLKGCPPNYVKLVYCLGYGENKLIKSNIKDGTPGFWKIFTSCVNENPSSQFGKVQKKTHNSDERLQNKINLLKKLKENGIWLVDASIVALYKNNSKPIEKISERIIRMSWDQHIAQIVQEEKPEKIIVIGKGVSKALQGRLHSTNIPIYVQEQPRMLSSEKWKEYAEKYYELCNS